MCKRPDREAQSSSRVLTTPVPQETWTYRRHWPASKPEADSRVFTNAKGDASSAAELKFFDFAEQPATTQRKLYFSEEFGGTNGPIQFYITVDGQKQKVFEPNEKPVITTKVGAIEDWTIENRALETHAFHIHQIHFRVMEIDGKPVANNDLRDTIEIPYWMARDLITA